MLDALHPSLRGAIEAGWEGLTLAEDEDEDKGVLVLVCAMRAARTTARRDPCLGGRRAPPPTTGGLIILSIETGDAGTLELGIDLAYAGGRALALRLADDAVLRVLLVGRDEVAHPVLARVSLREEARGMLRRSAATAGEWRVADPPPDGPSAEEPLPRLAPAPGEPGVALHVPMERLPGLTDGRGVELALKRRRGDDPPLLLVRARDDADAAPLRLTLGCRRERALAARARGRGGFGSWA